MSQRAAQVREQYQKQLSRSLQQRKSIVVTAMLHAPKVILPYSVCDKSEPLLAIDFGTMSMSSWSAGSADAAAAGAPTVSSSADVAAAAAAAAASSSSSDEDDDDAAVGSSRATHQQQVPQQPVTVVGSTQLKAKCASLSVVLSTPEVFSVCCVVW